jgi:hypothetical protein
MRVFTVYETNKWNHNLNSKIIYSKCSTCSFIGADFIQNECVLKSPYPLFFVFNDIDPRMALSLSYSMLNNTVGTYKFIQ